MAKEIFDSMKNYIKEKLSSPVYGTFFITWLVCHYKIFIVLFFVDESNIWNKFQLLKDEYIIYNYCNFKSLEFWILWLIPIFVTYLVIWEFPKYITIPAYKKIENDNTEKKIFKIRKEKEVEELRNEFMTEKISSLSLKEERIKKTKEIENMDPSILWEEEYGDFLNSKFFDIFSDIIKSIYEKQGNISWYYEGSTKKHFINSELLAYAHANGLIEFSNDNNKIKFTDKGKFYVKKYSLDKDKYISHNS